MQKLVFYLLIPLFISLHGCARLDPGLRKSNAQQFAIGTGFTVELLSSQKFKIWSAQKVSENPTEKLVVYIEGDGLAFKRRNRPSKDPTPIDFFTLQLAAHETADSVIYLARPCQYLDQELLNDCKQKYWTSHRYSEEVITSYEELLDSLKKQISVKQFVLVGYSGGGNIAAHLATRRSDVTKLITIAANLDLESWTEFHSLPLMKHSLNPAAIKELEFIDQIHFVGENDSVVPPLVAKNFFKKIGAPANAELIIRSGFDHYCCWLEQWQGVNNLLNE